MYIRNIKITFIITLHFKIDLLKAIMIKCGNMILKKRGDTYENYRSSCSNN